MGFFSHNTPLIGIEPRNGLSQAGDLRNWFVIAVLPASDSAEVTKGAVKTPSSITKHSLSHFLPSRHEGAAPRQRAPKPKSSDALSPVSVKQASEVNSFGDI